MTSTPDKINHGIRDNHQYPKVADFLQDKISTGNRLAIVSAYFTIYAYDALADQLEKIHSLRFLFGEPSFTRSLDSAKTTSKSFHLADQDLELTQRLQQKSIARRCANWIRNKVEIRSIRQANLLHGKLYHIQDGNREHALLGSSNFTQRGLGLAQDPNIELNLIVDSDRDRAALKTWFDTLWADAKKVENVKHEVLAYLQQLYINQTPEFIYFKTLYHLFEKTLADQAEDDRQFQQTHFYETAIWQALYDFQKSGVKAAIQKLKNHNGCILADSVGLGKTWTALAIIKYHQLRNQNVLVICPRKLHENWKVYLAHHNSDLNPFLADRFNYSLLSHTDLSRQSGTTASGIDLANFQWGNYDLIVIDESHNFRNNTRGKRDEQGNIIRKSRYERLMQDIIQTGIDTKVLLLSATPVNNSLQDLRNQIYLATKDQDAGFADKLGIQSIKTTLSSAQQCFAKWTEQNPRNEQGERDKRPLMDSLPAGFFTLLNALTIARSRRHIKRYYPESMQQIGTFPERLPPKSLYTAIDRQKEFPSYDQINTDIQNYQLALYNPSRYLLHEFQPQYAEKDFGNLTQANRETFLIGMMKVNFLKRLESSVHSFATTMTRTVDKIKDLEKRLQQFQTQQTQKSDTPTFELDTPNNEEDDEDGSIADVFVDNKRRFRLAHLNIPAWQKDLAADRQQLAQLAAAAHKIDAHRDAKLAKLKAILANKVRHPAPNKTNRKTLIFCAFADTAAYLYDQLENWAQQELKVHIALVSGGARPNRATFGKVDYTEILTNFAPRAKQRDRMQTMPQDGEIDILIATDCISEGQNLQDCDTVINYDIHWNPVRIIQRFGRIDRIGSPNKAIQLLNFWPTEDLNQYINLKNRVEARMALLDLAATGDDNILEHQTLITEELDYRGQQLLRFEKEIPDLEELNETVALSEFTLADFHADLLAHLKANQAKLAEAPLGLYALVPPPTPLTPTSTPASFSASAKKPPTQPQKHPPATQ